VRFSSLLPPHPVLFQARSSGFSSSFWSFSFGFLYFLGVDLWWLGHLLPTRAPPEASPACSGLNRRHRFCGWPPRRCAWLMGSFVSWVVDLRCLRTCLTGGLSVVFRLFPTVGAAAGGRHASFRHA
jgi:hypothetical protein